MPKIVNFAVPYSSNLGDGLIAQCLAFAIEKRVPDAEVLSVDLAGRTRFGARTMRHRSAVLQTLTHLPKPLRRRVVYRAISRSLATVTPSWSGLLAGADYAVIGGGQLFSDADLNFPMKIGQAAQLVRNVSVPVAVYAVGVSENWSAEATRLFRLLRSTDLRLVGVRDSDSQNHWRTQMGERAEPVPRITRDPGLLAAACYGPVRSTDAVAVGITASEVLAYHATGPVVGGKQGVQTYIADVAVHLAKAGHRVRLFCNGADEDRRALAQVAAAPVLKKLADYGRLEVAAPPETPEGLVNIVAPCKAVVAHRLHASILSYAYKRPCIGLAWDKKVRSFFTSVGCEDWMIESSAVSPVECSYMVERALLEGVSPTHHRRVIDETWEGIDALIHALGLTVAVQERPERPELRDRKAHHPAEKVAGA